MGRLALQKSLNPKIYANVFNEMGLALESRDINVLEVRLMVKHRLEMSLDLYSGITHFYIQLIQI